MLSAFSSRFALRSLFASLMCIGFGVFPSVTQAGIITSAQIFGINAGTGPGLGTVDVPVISTGTQNNDNQTGGGPADNNITVPVKRFDNIGYIDIIFNVATSGGVTEYSVVESVDNNTGINWSSYTMQLGFGTGLGFNLSPSGDGLDFDAPGFDLPPTVSGGFTNVVTGVDTLLFDNGIHSSGLETYQFRIDVPDGITQFTLRQTPVAVPEPGSLFLLGGLASLGLLVYRRQS